MTYDSPKQIRNRQQAAENRTPRRTRQAQTVKTTKTLADPDWNSACDFHVERIQHEISMGRSDSAGRHAEALAHCAVTRMAFAIMASERPGLDEAMKRAKARLYDVEVE